MSNRFHETNDKIGEAKYFLNKIKELEKDGDDNEFDYNLNAFLHSWASIFDLMLEDYQRFYQLRISMLEDLSIHSFRENAQGNEIALDFIETYNQTYVEFFGHKNPRRILDLLDEPMRLEEFLVFLLRKINWSELGYHDCYIALYNVIQEILGWGLSYHRLIMNPTIMSRQNEGFDVRFIREFFRQNDFPGLEMNLSDIFEQEFLRQRVAIRQEQRLSFDPPSFEAIREEINRLTVQVPIYTIAGLLKKKRHTKTHRRGTESMGTIQHFQGDELLDKSRLLNFLREDYVNEVQGMVFGHFNTPLDTIETCEDMFKRANRFVEEITEQFPIVDD